MKVKSPQQIEKTAFIASRTCAEPGSGSNNEVLRSFTSDFMRPLSVSAPLLFMYSYFSFNIFVEFDFFNEVKLQGIKMLVLWVMSGRRGQERKNIVWEVKISLFFI